MDSFVTHGTHAPGGCWFFVPLSPLHASMRFSRAEGELKPPPFDVRTTELDPGRLEALLDSGDAPHTTNTPHTTTPQGHRATQHHSTTTPQHHDTATPQGRRAAARRSNTTTPQRHHATTLRRIGAHGLPGAQASLGRAHDARPRLRDAARHAQRIRAVGRARIVGRALRGRRPRRLREHRPVLPPVLDPRGAAA